jgi:hypothetical protein
MMEIKSINNKMKFSKISNIHSRRMDKKGESYLETNLIYIILFIIFMITGMAFLYKYQNNVYFWEQYYSYTIAKSVNNAQVGDRVELIFNKAVELARKEGIADYKNIVSVDNVKKEIGVSLQKGKKTVYPFLRNYNIDNVIVEEEIKGYVLKFSVISGGVK